MKFYKGNKIADEFDMPAAEVADQFAQWYWAQDGASEAQRDFLPLERLLRWWLSTSEHFNSTWVEEHGPESFDTLWDLARAKTRALNIEAPAGSIEAKGADQE